MEANIEAKATASAGKASAGNTSAGTSAWVALLPLGFIAIGICAIAFAASLAVRARPAPVLATPAAAEPMSPREEARLAAQITAFALAKVAPERFEAEVRDVSKPSSELLHAKAKLAARKNDKPAMKVATVLPPHRPATITASVALPPHRPAIVTASAAPQPPSLIPVGFGPAIEVEPKPGILTQMANYVPSPRRILSDAMSDAWSLGGKVGKLIPKI